MTDWETNETPFIERPDEHTPGDANELYCWMPNSDHRECNGSCVAYDPSFMADQVRDPCKALNAFRSLAKSVAMLVGLQQKKEKQAETAAVKAHIDNLPPPPKV